MKKLPEKLRERKKAQFIHYYRQLGLLTKAAEMAGTTTNTIRVYMKQDEEFAAAVQEAEDDFVDSILAEAYKRGIEGIEEPLSYKGHLTGDTVTKKSDAVLLKLLEAKVPGFSKRLDIDHQHTHSGGVLVVEAGLDDLEDWKKTFSPIIEVETQNQLDTEE